MEFRLQIRLQFAKMAMTVVVTDHHEVPFEDTEEGRKYKLPLADAIINPNSLTVRIQIKISVAQWLQ